MQERILQDVTQKISNAMLLPLREFQCFLTENEVSLPIAVNCLIHYPQPVPDWEQKFEYIYQLNESNVIDETCLALGRCKSVDKLKDYLEHPRIKPLLGESIATSLFAQKLLWTLCSQEQIIKEDIQVFDYLVRLNISPLSLFTQNNQDFCPFASAVQRGHTMLIRHYIETYQPPIQDFSRIQYGEGFLSLLNLAVRHIKPELVAYFLENKVPIPKRARNGMSTLDHACTHTELEIVELLLDKSDQSSYVHDALMQVCEREKENLPLATLLLTKVCDCDLPSCTRHGDTTLQKIIFKALDQGHLNIVRQCFETYVELSERQKLIAYELQQKECPHERILAVMDNYFELSVGKKNELLINLIDYICIHPKPDVNVIKEFLKFFHPLYFLHRHQPKFTKHEGRIDLGHLFVCLLSTAICRGQLDIVVLLLDELKKKGIKNIGNHPFIRNKQDIYEQLVRLACHKGVRDIAVELIERFKLSSSMSMEMKIKGEPEETVNCTVFSFWIEKYKFSNSIQLERLLKRVSPSEKESNTLRTKILNQLAYVLNKLEEDCREIDRLKLIELSDYHVNKRAKDFWEEAKEDLEKLNSKAFEASDTRQSLECLNRSYTQYQQAVELEKELQDNYNSTLRRLNDSVNKTNKKLQEAKECRVDLLKQVDLWLNFNPKFDLINDRYFTPRDFMGKISFLAFYVRLMVNHEYAFSIEDSLPHLERYIKDHHGCVNSIFSSFHSAFKGHWPRILNQSSIDAIFLVTDGCSQKLLNGQVYFSADEESVLLKKLDSDLPSFNHWFYSQLQLLKSYSERAPEEEKFVESIIGCLTSGISVYENFVARQDHAGISFKSEDNHNDFLTIGNFPLILDFCLRLKELTLGKAEKYAHIQVRQTHKFSHDSDTTCEVLRHYLSLPRIEECFKEMLLIRPQFLVEHIPDIIDCISLNDFNLNELQPELKKIVQEIFLYCNKDCKLEASAGLVTIKILGATFSMRATEEITTATAVEIRQALEAIQPNPSIIKNWLIKKLENIIPNITKLPQGRPQRDLKDYIQLLFNLYNGNSTYVSPCPRQVEATDEHLRLLKNISILCCKLMPDARVIESAELGQTVAPASSSSSTSDRKGKRPLEEGSVNSDERKKRQKTHDRNRLFKAVDTKECEGDTDEEMDIPAQ